MFITDGVTVEESMKAPLAIEIAMTRVFAEQLPRTPAWVGEGLFSDGVAFTVALVSYGEAALSVVRVHSSATASDAGDWDDPAEKQNNGTFRG